MSNPPLKSHYIGSLYALGAFCAWGLLPVYWKSFGNTSAMEILSHRMMWSLIFLIVLIFLKREWLEFKKIFANKQSLFILCLTSIIIGINWLVYIWAVNNNHIIEASLGYFINPLINILLAVVLLNESLNPRQLLAVLLAAIGVLISIIKFGDFPWIALTLAFTFAFYGYFRKIVRVESVVGLTFETAILSPLAIAHMIFLQWKSSAVFLTHWQTDLLFAGAGIITATPLAWFASGARKIRLSTLGFFQYLTPSIQLVIGVFIYKEDFTKTHLITFGLIWCALLIHTLDSLYPQHANRKR